MENVNKWSININEKITKTRHIHWLSNLRPRKVGKGRAIMAVVQTAIDVHIISPIHSKFKEDVELAIKRDFSDSVINGFAPYDCIMYSDHRLALPYTKYEINFSRVATEAFDEFNDPNDLIFQYCVNGKATVTERFNINRVILDSNLSPRENKKNFLEFIKDEVINRIKSEDEDSAWYFSNYDYPERIICARAIFGNTVTFYNLLLEAMREIEKLKTEYSDEDSLCIIDDCIGDLSGIAARTRSINYTPKKLKRNGKVVVGSYFWRKYLRESDPDAYARLIKNSCHIHERVIERLTKNKK